MKEVLKLEVSGHASQKIDVVDFATTVFEKDLADKIRIADSTQSRKERSRSDSSLQSRFKPCILPFSILQPVENSHRNLS